MEYHEFNCKHCDHRTYYKEAMVRHVAEKHGDTARSEDQARIEELMDYVQHKQGCHVAKDNHTEQDAAPRLHDPDDRKVAG